MRALLGLLLVACSAPVAPQQPVLAAMKPREVARRAEEALGHARAPDYSRPMLVTPRARPEASEWFHGQCAGGDHDACRTEAWLLFRGPGDDPSVFHEVVDECRRGDLPSCRALPHDLGEPGDAQLAGFMSRRVECFDGPTAACDLPTLVRECNLHFAMACFELARAGETIYGTAEDFRRRGQLYARGSCNAGDLHLCELADGGRACALSDDCSGLADELEQSGDRIRDRDVRELQCQYGRLPYSCAKLAELYLFDVLPEPVPGRGHVLLAWACPRLETEVEICRYWKAHQVPGRGLVEPALPVGRAEASLRRERPLDYLRPMVPKPTARSESAALFHERCTRGEHDACRTEAWLRFRTGNDPRVFDVVADQCRHGDALGCRALPPGYDEARGVSLPGATSRRADCYPFPRSSCAIDRLVEECDAHFATACDELATPPSMGIRTDVAARGRLYADESCAAGDPHLCISRPGDVAANERACVYEDRCNALALDAQEAGDRVRERELRELDCQYAGAPERCAELAELYLLGILSEPVPGRAHALQAWACSRGHWDLDVCTVWERRRSK